MNLRDVAERTASPPLRKQMQNHPKNEMHVFLALCREKRTQTDVPFSLGASPQYLALPLLPPPPMRHNHSPENGDTMASDVETLSAIRSAERIGHGRNLVKQGVRGVQEFPKVDEDVPGIDDVVVRSID